MFNYWQIEIDGIDKAGKDLILKYLERIGNWKYCMNSRGLISQLAFAKKYGRDYVYNISNLSKHTVYVFLEAEPEDIKIRCEITNEPKFNIESDLKIFRDTFEEVKKMNVPCLEYNTSHMTPYEIAINIHNKINEMENNYNG